MGRFTVPGWLGLIGDMSDNDVSWLSEAGHVTDLLGCMTIQYNE